MFAFLRGTVAEKGTDAIALDVGGVGYRVQVPDLIQRKLALNQEVMLLTYCHIREDDFQIFGFLRQEEKTLFQMLLSISGVGPKAALALLSTLSVSEFGQAVSSSDVKTFTRAPGVGKKMAQRIVLEMKTKMGQDPELEAILGETDENAVPAESDDVFEALVSLGCTAPEAKKAGATARRELGKDAPPEELVRAALRTLSKV